MLAPGGRGTSVHVLFTISAEYSSCIAVSQWVSRRAACTDFGMGETTRGATVAELLSAYFFVWKEDADLGASHHWVSGNGRRHRPDWWGRWCKALRQQCRCMW